MRTNLSTGSSTLLILTTIKEITMALPPGVLKAILAKKGMKKGKKKKPGEKAAKLMGKKKDGEHMMPNGKMMKGKMPFKKY